MLRTNYDIIQDNQLQSYMATGTTLYKNVAYIKSLGFGNKLQFATYTDDENITTKVLSGNANNLIKQTFSSSLVQLRVSSNESAGLVLEADIDASSTTEMPYIYFGVDNSAVQSMIGITTSNNKTPTNNTLTGAIANSLVIGDNNTSGGLARVQIGLNNKIIADFYNTGQVTFSNAVGLYVGNAYNGSTLIYFGNSDSTVAATPITRYRFSDGVGTQAGQNYNIQYTVYADKSWYYQTYDGVYQILANNRNLSIIGNASGANVIANFGSGSGVLAFNKVTTAPTANPTDALILWVDGTTYDLKLRKPDGTVGTVSFT